MRTTSSSWLESERAFFWRDFLSESSGGEEGKGQAMRASSATMLEGDAVAHARTLRVLLPPYRPIAITITVLALHYSLLRRGEKAPHTALSRMAGKGGDMRAARSLARSAINQRPLYNHTTPEPLKDQCWWEWAKRFGKSTREQIGALPPPYRRQLGSIVREFQRLLRCSAAKRVFEPSEEPLHRSTQAFCRSSKCCSEAVLG
ncbi:hypothetical protein Q7P35_005664 [Cladosporium inversicolor]